jgi:hypothetical protein
VKVSATRIVLCVGAAVAIAGCGGDSNEGSAGTQPTSTTPATATAPSATTPPEEPVTVQVNGESRTVTLSRVDSAYCAKKTDVCAALRGANFDRLSSEGKSAVLQARRRKATREAQERQQELEQQQQQEQQQAPPQPQEEGTTTG